MICNRVAKVRLGDIYEYMVCRSIDYDDSIHGWNVLCEDKNGFLLSPSILDICFVDSDAKHLLSDYYPEYEPIPNYILADLGNEFNCYDKDGNEVHIIDARIEDCMDPNTGEFVKECLWYSSDSDIYRSGTMYWKKGENNELRC